MLENHGEHFIHVLTWGNLGVLHSEKASCRKSHTLQDISGSVLTEFLPCPSSGQKSLLYLIPWFLCHPFGSCRYPPPGPEFSFIPGWECTDCHHPLQLGAAKMQPHLQRTISGSLIFFCSNLFLLWFPTHHCGVQPLKGHPCMDTLIQTGPSMAASHP